MPNFTPTEQRILNLLGDGTFHRKDEVKKCLSDDMSCESNLYTHLSNLRKKLKEIGEGILCQREAGEALYMHVRLVAKGQEE